MNLKDYLSKDKISTKQNAYDCNQNMSRLERILSQVNVASNIVREHRSRQPNLTNTTQRYYGKESLGNKSNNRPRADFLSQEARRKFSEGYTEQQAQPELEQVNRRHNLLSPQKKIDINKLKLMSKVDYKVGKLIQQDISRNDNQKYCMLERTLTSLQSRVQEARVELVKHIKSRPIEPFNEHRMKSKPLDKHTEVRQEEDLLNTKTIVKGHTHTHITPMSSKISIDTQPSNYYIGELIRSINQRHSLAIEHVRESISIFRYFRNFQRKPKEISIKLNLPQIEYYRNKKTIVFDLDETLIHYSESCNNDYDIKLSIVVPTGQTVQAHVKIRPYALILLNNLREHFELMVWTASEKTYANAILNFLDPDNKIFRYRLFADSCYQHPEGPIKDLQAINRRPSDIIIIDNSPYSYGIQQANAIPILPFYGSDTDNQLKSLEEYLLRLEPVFDIRQLNTKTFKLHHYTEFEDAKQLIEKLYLQSTNQ